MLKSKIHFTNSCSLANLISLTWKIIKIRLMMICNDWSICNSLSEAKRWRNTLIFIIMEPWTTPKASLLITRRKFNQTFKLRNKLKAKFLNKRNPQKKCKIIANPFRARHLIYHKIFREGKVLFGILHLRKLNLHRNHINLILLIAQIMKELSQQILQLSKWKSKC